MKSFLKRNPDDNLTDSIADGLIENMGYSNTSYLYPETDKIKPNQGVLVEWFYPIINSPENFSEMTAVFQYTTQSAMFGEVSTLLMSIAFVEMRHLDKIRDVITHLGGTINDSNWNPTLIKYGNDPIEALKEAINGEQATINFYKELKTKILMLPQQNETTETCIQLLSKLIADEILHYKLLNEKLKEL